MLYETLSALDSWSPLQLEAPDYGQPPKHIFQWSAVDETTDGKVQFVTTVDIDASTPADVSQDAWGRMLCFYIVSRLSGKALADACQSLVDSYTWQIQQTRPIPQIPEKKHLAVSRVRRVERVPFDFDDD